MKLVVSLGMLLLSAWFCSAQQEVPNKKRAQINLLLVNGNYPKALELINEIKDKHPDDDKLKLQLGICYLYSNIELPAALSLLQQSVVSFPLKGKTMRDGIETNFYYGQTFHKLERFLEAKEVFESLRKQIPARQKQLLARVDKEWEMAKNAIELSVNPVRFKISNLGSVVNTPLDEHSPLVSADESLLVFTSNRLSTGNVQTSDGGYFEDIYVSEYQNGAWLEPKSIGNVLNSKGNNASVSLSPDGNKLIIYQHDGLSGDLYESKFGANGWSEPAKLPSPINTSYNETHGSFSSDGNTFVFTSDRPSGFGGRDIYMVRKLPQGDWGKVVNLGAAINTEGDEESPFLHPDGKTMYFASTEHKTIGGYDIFMSELSDSTLWSTPVNVGYPINTPGDDLFYIPSADGTRVYFASQRNKGEGGSDLYLIEFDESDPRSLAVVSGFVLDRDKKPFPDVNIAVFDAVSGNVEGYYKPNLATGKYVMILPSGKSYKAVFTSPNNTYELLFSISSRQSYQSGNWAHYLEPIFVDEVFEVH